MKKRLDLCVPCAEKLRAGFTITQIARSVNQKITCYECRRRRYGATYEVTPK